MKKTNAEYAESAQSAQRENGIKYSAISALIFSLRPLRFILFIFCFSLSSLLLCDLCVKKTSAATENKKFKVYMIRIEGADFAGESAGSWIGMLRKLVSALSKATGYDLEFVLVDSDEFFSAIGTGKADFTGYTTEAYSLGMDGWLRDYKPLVAPVFLGQNNHKFCIYVYEGKGFNKLEDLKGSRIHITINTYGYGHFAQFLDDAGIKEPVGDFYREITVTSSMATSFMQLKTGDIDAVFDSSDEAAWVLSTNSALKGAKPLVCSQGYTNLPIIYRSDLPDEAVAKVGGALLGAHKSKDFQEVRLMFAAVNMKFVRVTKEDYESYKKHYNAAWNKGLFHEVYEALPPAGYEEQYKEPEDMFKGKYKDFVEIEKMLGEGEYKKAYGAISQLKRKVKDKRLYEMEKQIGVLASGGAGKPATGSKCPPNMVYVPAGEFTMGADTPMTDEKHTHKEKTGAFCIDMYEYPNVKGVRPRVGVKWNEAKGLCAAQGKRLPTEAEWEKAARGADGRMFPWGNKWDPKKANASGTGDGYAKTAPSGSYPGGKSPYGAYDMAGNLWEMVYDWNYYSGMKTKPWKSGKPYDLFVLRGGSWNRYTSNLRASSRYWLLSDWYHDRGFRCALDL